MYKRSAVDRKAEAARYREITEASTIPSISLEKCDYDKSRRVLKLTSEYIGMPKTFFVRSHHTGKEVRFISVGPEDKLFDQDQWDGEMQVYRPTSDVPNVDHMVIYHAY